MVLLVNERGKYIVEEEAHDECMSTFWMGLLFETDTWQLFRGFYSTEGGTKHEIVKVTHSPQVQDTSW